MRSGAKNIVVFLPIVILASTATKTASGGEFCKWTDENGVVHYDVNCEDDATTSTVVTEGRRTEGQKQAAEEYSKSLQAESTQPIKSPGKSQRSISGNSAGATTRSRPQDFSQMSAEQLDAMCQQEREKLIAPERERLIQDCIENKRKSQGYCERYFADYGNAQRLDTGMVRPALYLDLPECVAAFEARKKEK